MGVRLRVPGAADESLRPLVIGPLRIACVIAAVTDAVHLEVEAVSPEIEPTLVVVCGLTAVRLPGSVVVPQPLAAVLEPGRPHHATVGSGRVEVGGIAIEVRRWMATPRPRLRDINAAARQAFVVAGRIPPLPPPLDRRTSALVEALHSVRHASCGGQLHAAVGRLIGLGPGLTPAGDDVLAGIMLALHAAGDPRLRVLAAEVVAPRDRTTAVSAALLHAAATGTCIPQAARFVGALDGRADVEPSLAALLAVGHTSGAGLAAGIVLALSECGAATTPGREDRRVSRSMLPHGEMLTTIYTAGGSPVEAA